MTKSFLFICLLMCLALGEIATVKAQGTAFTYQGRLSNGSTPVSGTYDLSFTLYSNSTTVTVLSGPVTNSSVVVTSNGDRWRLFTGRGVCRGYSPSPQHLHGRGGRHDFGNGVAIGELQFKRRPSYGSAHRWLSFRELE